VQCGLAARGGYRCEAAGATLQPSLQSVLTPERVKRLTALGWRLDPHFGNYVQTFPASSTAGQVAFAAVLALETGYDVENLIGLEVETDWLPSEPCPPRNGFSQNLAGMINNAPAMAATAIRACDYAPPQATPNAGSAELLTQLYGPRVTAEIQRLRVNLRRNVFAVFDAGIGYIQCEPQTSPDVIYCEAQSPASWAALSSVLTPERLARLHGAGYADPGRAELLEKLSARAIRRRGDRRRGDHPAARRLRLHRRRAAGDQDGSRPRAVRPGALKVPFVFDADIRLTVCVAAVPSGASR
jgi:hypothetical protein